MMTKEEVQSQIAQCDAESEGRARAHARKLILAEDATTPEPPRFKHDCPSCKYLGRFDSAQTNARYDLYFCARGRWDDSVLARWGDHRADYVSGMNQTSRYTALTEAKRRAIAAGLLPAEPTERTWLDERFDAMAMPTEPEPSMADVTEAFGDVLSYFGLDENGQAWEIEEAENPLYSKFKAAIAVYERVTGKPNELGIKFLPEEETQ